MVESRYANLKADLVAGPDRPGSVPSPMDNYRPPSRPTIQPPMAHAPYIKAQLVLGYLIQPKSCIQVHHIIVLLNHLPHPHLLALQWDQLHLL